MSCSCGSVTEPDYVAVNRESWTRANAEYTDARAREAWAQEEITWGKWSLPEREVQVLPDVTGKEIVELGCGTAYFGGLAEATRGARVVGVDARPRSSRRRGRWSRSSGSSSR